MATEASIISAVRTELGDVLESFRDNFRGTGDKNDFNLPARNVASVTSVYTVTGDDQIIYLSEPADYVVDKQQGVITFTDPPEEDALYFVEGQANGIFTDEEIAHFITGAVSQHLKGRVTQKRYRDGHGFIKYDRKQMTLADLPAEEEILITLLTTIEALWALSTDAATDIDITTSEGTHIPRSQRWRQLMAQIDVLTDKYKEISGMMGVGLYSPEVLDMRRTSRTTGRLVPIFESREYDETGPPIRKLPPRSNRDEDADGPETPFWSGGWGY